MGYVANEPHRSRGRQSTVHCGRTRTVAICHHVGKDKERCCDGQHHNTNVYDCFDRDADSHPQADAKPNRSRRSAHAYAYQYGYPSAYTNSYPCAHTNDYPFAYADGYGHADTHGYAYACADPYANAGATNGNADPYANAGATNGDADIHSYSYGHGHADTQPQADQIPHSSCQWGVGRWVRPQCNGHIHAYPFANTDGHPFAYTDGYPYTYNYANTDSHSGTIDG